MPVAHGGHDANACFERRTSDQPIDGVDREFVSGAQNRRLSLSDWSVPRSRRDDWVRGGLIARYRLVEGAECRRGARQISAMEAIVRLCRCRRRQGGNGARALWLDERLCACRWVPRVVSTFGAQGLRRLSAYGCGGRDGWMGCGWSRSTGRNPLTMFCAVCGPSLVTVTVTVTVTANDVPVVTVAGAPSVTWRSAPVPDALTVSTSNPHTDEDPAFTESPEYTACQ